MDFALCRKIMKNVSSVMVGKAGAIELLMVALLSEGHVLIEDVPGLGKTLLAKALAKSIGGSFKRVQFTPDLLPSDITGFNIYSQKTAQFAFQPGPVMANVLLADEINRTIPRTQSSLLESMEERQVTVDSRTYDLPRPFFVIATQNPIELEGTFPLPEAQLDRFLLRINLGYPSPAEEIEILERFRERDPFNELAPVARPEEIARLQDLRKAIVVSRPVKEYIASIAAQSRSNERVRFGISPRGSLGLMRAGQALAALRGRDYTLPDDIKHLAPNVLAHRLILKEQEQMTGHTSEQFIRQLLELITIPQP